MKKSLIVASIFGMCLAAGSCLSVNESALGNLAKDALCTAATAELPYSGYLNYCSVVDIDLGLGEETEE